MGRPVARLKVIERVRGIAKRNSFTNIGIRELQIKQIEAYRLWPNKQAVEDNTRQTVLRADIAATLTHG